MACFVTVTIPAAAIIRITSEYGAIEWGLGCISAIWIGARVTVNGCFAGIKAPIFTRTKSNGVPNLGRLANAPTPGRQPGTTYTEPPFVDL